LKWSPNYFKNILTIFLFFFFFFFFWGGGGPRQDSVSVTNINVMLNVVMLGMFFINSIEMFQKNIYGTYLYNSLVMYTI